MRPTTGSNCEVVSSATFESGFNDLGFDDGNFAKGMTRCKAALTLQSARGPAGEIVFGTRRSVSAREELVWVEDSHGHGGLQRIRTIVLRVVQEIALPGWEDPATGLARTFTGDVVIDVLERDYPARLFSCASWAGLPFKGCLYGPDNVESAARMLYLAHELAGTGANRAAIEILGIDTLATSWKDAHFSGTTGIERKWAPFAPFGKDVNGNIPVAMRVPGQAVAIQMFDNDGNAFIIYAKPSYLVPLGLVAQAKDLAKNVVLEYVDFEFTGEGGQTLTSRMHAWIGIDQSYMHAMKRASAFNALAHNIALPCAAALAINKPAGMASTATGVIQASAARVLAIVDVACTMAAPGTSSRSVLIKRGAGGSLKVAMPSEEGVEDEDFVPLAQFAGFTTRVPVVAIEDNPLDCTHATDLQTCKWQAMTYEQWVTWHFPALSGKQREDKLNEAYTFICFVRGAWPRGSRFDAPAGYYSW